MGGRGSGRGRRRDEGRDPEVVRLYAEGLTLKEVADRLGLSLTGARSALQRRGVPRRLPGRLKDGATTMGQEARVAEMFQLRDAGWTYREIGRHFGVSSQCVNSTLLAARRRAGECVAAAPIACRECGAILVQWSHLGVRRPLPALCLSCLARHPEASFIDRLRAFRLAAGLTQEQLTARAGLVQGAVAKFERGKREPRWSQVMALAGVLGNGLLVLNSGVPGAPGEGHAGR